MHPSWIAGYQDAWEMLSLTSNERLREENRLPEARIIEAIRKYGRPEDKATVAHAPSD